MASKRAINTVSKALAVLLLVVVMLAVSGCGNLKAVNYEFGDIHRIYCSSYSKELRAQLKATLTEKGAKIDVNYCASFDLVDVMLIKPIQKAKKE